MDAKKLGLFIAAQRKNLQMTQSDLADKIYVTNKAVSRWERGIGFPDINTLEPLANALEITISELIQCEKKETNTEDNSIKNILTIAKEEQKNHYHQFKKTFLLFLLCLGIVLFLHIVTFSNQSAGWFICFILAFIFGFINIAMAFYRDHYEPCMLAFLSVVCASLGILESYLMASKWITGHDMSALYDVVPFISPTLNVMMYVIIIINLVSFFIKYKKNSSR